ncbi:adhesion G-protein coupled receptor G5 [Hoplias malabaricus]|uniref:adhesion G-protein coupled receptor G5 n=1 Tax=Hoplias malabaricus TaxID=27720 RepID=UPI003462D826
MPLFKWTFLWSAALVITYAAAYDYSCQKYIFITDFNSSVTSTSSQCNYFYKNNMNMTSLLWTDRCSRNITQGELGVCSFGTSNYSYNVSKYNDRYEVFLYGNVSGIKLRVITNASILLPSFNCCRSDHLKFIDVPLDDKCNQLTPYNSTACAGKNVTYILSVQFNRSTHCWSCSPERIISLPSESKISQGKMSDILDNITSLVSTLGDADYASVRIGIASGLIQKQTTDTDVSVGFVNGTWIQVVNSHSQDMNLDFSLEIPDEAFNIAGNQTNKTAFVVVLQFPDISLDNSSSSLLLKSDIFGISMGANISNITKTINLTFRHVDKIEPGMACYSWDGEGNMDWTTSGCATHISKTTIKCSCTHLTFFAILLALPNQTIPEADVTNLTYITCIGCGLSTFFLLTGLFIHFVLWRCKTTLGTTFLMNLFVALSLLNITFLSNQQITSSKNSMSCIIIAATMHYSMLATFTWFFIQGLHFYISLTGVIMKNRKYKQSLIFLGWGFPAVVVIIIACSGNYQSLSNIQICWISNIYIHFIVNVGYYALIFIFTSAIFIMVIRKIIQARFANNNIVRTSSKKTTAILGLLVLLGLTWGVAFFSYGAMAIPSYYIFTILNSFQGFFLFLYYYHFRNDEMGLSQSTTNTGLSINKDNVSTTTMSEPDTETQN